MQCFLVVANMYLVELICSFCICPIVGEEMWSTGENSGANMVVPNTSTNTLVNISSTEPSLMQGGYTSLLLGLDQNASAAWKLHFDMAV
jgi:hypothetical protein